MNYKKGDIIEYEGITYIGIAETLHKGDLFWSNVANKILTYQVNIPLEFEGNSMYIKVKIHLKTKLNLLLENE